MLADASVVSWTFVPGSAHFISVMWKLYENLKGLSEQQLNRFYDKHSHPMLRDEAYLKDYIFNWDTQSNVFLLLEKS